MIPTSHKPSTGVLIQSYEELQGIYDDLLPACLDQSPVTTLHAQEEGFFIVVPESEEERSDEERVLFLSDC